MLQHIPFHLPAVLLFGLLVSPAASAQTDDENEDEAVFEYEDGSRVIIIEGDSDGDRPRVLHRSVGGPNHFVRRGLAPGAAPHTLHRGEIVFRDEDGNERRFSLDGSDFEWQGGGDAAVSDTTIDGKRMIIIRSPDGEEEIIELDGLGPNSFSFSMPDFDHFRRDFTTDIPEMRLRMREGEGHSGFAFGPNFMHLESMMGASEETRREIMELERRSVEIASRLRERDDPSLERELDNTLGRLFELRGRARTERAEHMEEEAEEMRRRAQELRESLNDRNRDRENLIEERKRELLGRRSSGW